MLFITMLCIKYGKKCGISLLFNVSSKLIYSCHRNTSSYKVIKVNDDSLDDSTDIDNSIVSNSSNWELLTPIGFRFYLPGSVGPAWLNASTTAYIKNLGKYMPHDEKKFMECLKSKNIYHKNRFEDLMQPRFDWIVQECPVLLRKNLEELFPGCFDVTSPQLSIVTINQKVNRKLMQRHKEAETEKLAKYFVLAASELCTKLKMIGYWADFVNPFSGKPHMYPQMNADLYKTDQRFRCIGFKVERRSNCRIITSDNILNNFIGSLYTTAPARTDFIKQIIKVDD